MLPIKVTLRADRQIQKEAPWWLANRPKAPEAFREELQRGFDLISHQPGVGARAANVKLKGILRIHLSRIRYFLTAHQSLSVSETGTRARSFLRRQGAFPTVARSARWLLS